MVSAKLRENRRFACYLFCILNMNFLPLLEQKRDGGAHSPAQIAAIVSAYVAEQIPDYQMSAWLMAIYFRGLDDAEKRALTLAMRDSGATLSFPDDARPLVDKHSTGGVGDKVSLPLAPLLASLGCRVPMISGRGLGLTGGTLDKLESIPGFRTDWTPAEIVAKTQQIGCCMAGQTATMVPADRLLYALRDVTATVPSIPLITASILSKKLAENLDALILDVKWGRAAFMTTRAEAELLASSIADLGNACGTPTQTILSDMNVPLGRSAGNWLEVVESVECLQGRGPDDLRELVIECAARLLEMTNLASDLASARSRAASALDDGSARAKWDEMLVCQGADVEAFEAKLRAPSPVEVVALQAQTGGTVGRCDARIIAEVVRDLGGGRQAKNSVLNLDVGVAALKKPGEQVEAGESLCLVHAAKGEDAQRALVQLKDAFDIEPYS